MIQAKLRVNEIYEGMDFASINIPLQSILNDSQTIKKTIELIQIKLDNLRKRSFEVKKC